MHAATPIQHNLSKTQCRPSEPPPTIAGCWLKYAPAHTPRKPPAQHQKKYREWPPTGDTHGATLGRPRKHFVRQWPKSALRQSRCHCCNFAAPAYSLSPCPECICRRFTATIKKPQKPIQLFGVFTKQQF